MHTVILNGKPYTFESFCDAVGFAIMWNGILLTPINAM
jgi:hypothetical protein